MNVFIFTGPTLSAEEGARLLPGATFLPPAGSGDVYRAALRSPRAIGIIDGAFDQRLAVRHKEILWALTRGIRVYGAASMGALRAAELAAFGMRGVGTVFEWFRDGELEDDDEVTVAHALSENRFGVLSEALVNVRATCSRAAEQGVIDGDDAQAIVGCAKQLFYVDRTWPAILEGLAASTPGPPSSRLAAFERWLGEGRKGAVDLKGIDARRLLAVMEGDAKQDFCEPTAMPTFVLEETEAWVELKRHVERTLQSAASPVPVTAPQESPPPDAHEGARLLAELERTTPQQLPSVLQEATERALGLLLAEPGAGRAEAVQAASEAFRRLRGFLTPEATHAWMVRADLDVVGFSRLMDEDARVASAAQQTRQAVLSQVPSVLRRSRP